MSITRAEFFQVAKPKVKKISVEPYGDLYIKEMTGSERDEFEASLMDGSGKPQTRGMRARLAMLCVCDEYGERLFSDDDKDAINAAPAGALDKLFDHIATLNGLKSEEVEGN